MNLTAKDGREFTIRKYREADIEDIQRLNKEEGWTNLVEKQDVTKRAWDNSNVAYIVSDGEAIVAYIRGLTDQSVTLFICELMIDKDYRGLGIGQAFLSFVHHMYPTTRIEMLASSTSHTFYEQLGYRDRGTVLAFLKRENRPPILFVDKRTYLRL
ncbi:GNAT family N-acetyltransferase [Pullulanibacillus sp. KACC 23026]|uniref:GNAT family N-acetyltransferase n=1 Tax=Pullulanibacillus sp. KACC 23026 TaxID=3028315 RepID=UPI0023AFABF7|nr:GNAT family N-acetyltransferase [Pullulanibacillus sp. KACC 23026]WEG14429.1 GNAT family N-acetyltransferase [Pullulanibacillus sp. KACC 23026]